MSHLLKNLRRATYYQPGKRPRCMECRKRFAWIGRLPGDPPRGSLTDENFLVGLCSWACFGAFYGLVGENGPRCRCGDPVSVIGADCLPCQHVAGESTRYVYDRKRLLDGLQTTRSP